MKISARNVLKGRIASLKPGTVNSEVVIDLPGGQQLVAIVTKESAKKLKLKSGREAYAIVKASNVMIGVD